MKTYKKIVKISKKAITNTRTKQTLGVSTKWSYYQAKSILKPNKDIPTIKINKPAKTKQSKMSRQISKADYLELAGRYVKYVEKHNRLPAYIHYGNFKLKPRHLTVLFGKIVVYYYIHKQLPDKLNFNWKWFIKPTETGNQVYDYFCNKVGKKFKTMDDILNYVAQHFNYEFYFDDKKSNKQVSDTFAGNCTDLLQWLFNMLEALGYECKCIHVQCSSGTGHVFGKFRHPVHTGGEWVVRDIACISSNGSFCVWCENGYVLAVNPDWFLENLRR